jgi:hypothetical protein
VKGERNGWIDLANSYLTVSCSPAIRDSHGVLHEPAALFARTNGVEWEAGNRHGLPARPNLDQENFEFTVSAGKNDKLAMYYQWLLKKTTGGVTAVTNLGGNGAGARTPGEYFGNAVTGGLGTDLILDITVAADGSIADYTIVEPGSGYGVGDNLTVAGNLIGGATPGDDFTFDVQLIANELDAIYRTAEITIAPGVYSSLENLNQAVTEAITLKSNVVNPATRFEPLFQMSTLNADYDGVGGVLDNTAYDDGKFPLAWNGSRFAPEHKTDTDNVVYDITKAGSRGDLPLRHPIELRWTGAKEVTIVTQNFGSAVFQGNIAKYVTTKATAALPARSTTTDSTWIQTIANEPGHKFLGYQFVKLGGSLLFDDPTGLLWAPLLNNNATHVDSGVVGAEPTQPQGGSDLTDPSNGISLLLPVVPRQRAGPQGAPTGNVSSYKTMYYGPWSATIAGSGFDPAVLVDTNTAFRRVWQYGRSAGPTQSRISSQGTAPPGELDDDAASLFTAKRAGVAFSTIPGRDYHGVDYRATAWPTNSQGRGNFRDTVGPNFTDPLRPVYHSEPGAQTLYTGPDSTLEEDVRLTTWETNAAAALFETQRCYLNSRDISEDAEGILPSLSPSPPLLPFTTTTTTRPRRRAKLLPQNMEPRSLLRARRRNQARGAPAD